MGITRVRASRTGGGFYPRVRACEEKTRTRRFIPLVVVVVVVVAMTMMTVAPTTNPAMTP